MDEFHKTHPEKDVNMKDEGDVNKEDSLVKENVNVDTENEEVVEVENKDQNNETTKLSIKINTNIKNVKKNIYITIFSIQ
jgi:hypothetical protein